MRTLNSIDATKDLQINHPNQSESCLVDALSTIVNLSLDLSKEIFSIFGIMMHQLYQCLQTTFCQSVLIVSQTNPNIPLLTVAMGIGLLTLALTHFHSTSDDQIIHHQWQYYNPPGNF